MNLLLDANAEEITVIPSDIIKRVKEFIKRHNIPDSTAIQIAFGKKCKCGKKCENCVCKG